MRPKADAIVLAYILAASAGCGRIGYGPLVTADVPMDQGVDATATDTSMQDAVPDVGDTSCGASVTDFCTEIPSLGADPVIDGTLECGLTLATLTPAAWTGTAAIPAGVTASYTVAWRPTGLYFFVAVTSRTYTPVLSPTAIYCGDAVEFNVDSDGRYPASPNYDSPGAVQFFAAGPPNATSLQRYGITYETIPNRAMWTTSHEIAVGTPTGYAVEAFVNAQDLQLTTWTLSAGGMVGFDVVVDLPGLPNDASGACPMATPRLGQFALRVTTPGAPAAASCDGFPYCNVAAFCTAVLRR